MLNWMGRFSMVGSGDSSATMWMQSAGQMVGQHMQATHLGAPSGRCMSRWRPRKPGGAGSRTSG